MNTPAVQQQNQDLAPQVHAPAGDLVGTTADRGIQTRPSRYTQEERDLIRAMCGDDQISDGDIDMLNKVAARSGLDPFLKEIYLVGRKTKTGGYRGEPAKFETKWTIQTGIDGFRSTSKRYADARGEAMVISAPTYYNENGDSFPIWMKKWGYPAAAKMTVTIGKSSAEHMVTWDEYAQTKDEWVNGKKTGNKSPNSMWEQFGPTMLAKSAEAGAHRRVCPISAGMYVVEEMQQATQDERDFRRETLRATATRTDQADAALAAVTGALTRGTSTAQDAAHDAETVETGPEPEEAAPTTQAGTQGVDVDLDGYPIVITGDELDDARFAQTIEEIKASGDFDTLNEIYLRMHTTFTEPYLTAFTAALTYRREIVETDA
jgi:hypothetical protein